MEKEKHIQSRILRLIIQYASLIWALTGCISENPVRQGTVSIIFENGFYQTRSNAPDENKISDVNLIVFDEYGRAEVTLWSDRNLEDQVNIQLISGKRYRFIATANFGYKLDISDVSQLNSLTYHLVYPDEYRNGIPMTADTGYIMVEEGDQIRLTFVRLMSKISIQMDRSKLSDDIEMNVTGVRIGNCPKVVKAFAESSVKSAEDCFSLGFNKTGEECNVLNLIDKDGVSSSVNLYMMENMQGNFSVDKISSDHEKVFEINDSRRETCSYIEIDMDYLSPTKASTDGFLKYRFYLGESLNNLDIERNCHYRVIICPENDGLKEDSWRVDKSKLTDITPPTFSYYPNSYIRGKIGDKIHLGCHFTPSSAPFDVGLEYMENDKKEGIYDYIIDEDGHGAVLTLTGPGAGMIYMSAGPPVNESALWFIEVDLPKTRIRQ
jgi:hypothetical protein